MEASRIEAFLWKRWGRREAVVGGEVKRASGVKGGVR
jgi:hypothetical protein